MHQIPESDWKKFKTLHAKALEAFSSQILDECRSVCDDKSRTAHERYLDLFKLLEKCDKQVADLFNDYRRSTATTKVRALYQERFISEEELAEFSDEVQRLARIDFAPKQ